MKIKNQQVVIDSDLAELCQVKTKVLNQAVKRHIERFSKTDRFQLNDEEMGQLVTDCDRFKKLKHSTNLPFAFTQNGVGIVLEILKKNIQIDSLFYEENQTNLILQNDDLRSKIHTFRGIQVMLDFDLARLYQVETKRLKQAIKRNPERFPNDFMFELNDQEIEEVVSQFVTPSKSFLGGSKPYAFTEQGVTMLSSILNSQFAINMNIKIIRTFIQMRKLVANNATIFERLGNVEQKLISKDIKDSETDKKFDILFNALDADDLKPKQGIFYNGQVFDAYVFVSDLIKQAKKSIILIDNYIDESILTLFLKRNKNCKLIIYTQKISKQLQLDLDKHNKQYNNVTVKIFKDAHDRFLILDNKQIYHFGASLKDLGSKIFAFSKFNKEALNILGRLK